VVVSSLTLGHQQFVVLSATRQRGVTKRTIICSLGIPIIAGRKMEMTSSIWLAVRAQCDPEKLVTCGTHCSGIKTT
jgi:hypothetical protein